MFAYASCASAAKQRGGLSGDDVSEKGEDGDADKDKDKRRGKALASEAAREKQQTAAVPTHDESVLDSGHADALRKHTSVRSSTNTGFQRKREKHKEAESHQHEFPPPSSSFVAQNTMCRWRRETTRVNEKFFSPELVTTFLGAGAILTGVGIAEGLMVFKKGVTGRSILALRYGISQCFPSFVGESRCALDVATLFGRTETVIAELNPRQQRRLNNMQLGRALFGTLFGVSQIVKATDAIYEAKDEYNASVRKGKEPLFGEYTFFSDPIHREKIIRLAGSESDCCELSTERYGSHIVPIIEIDVKSNTWETMIEDLSEGGDIPVVWAVEGEKIT